jgi:hypothetical protein
VNRIDISYGGKPYSISGLSLEEFQSEVSHAATTSTPYWLKVNAHEGRVEDAYLLIAPGIPIAIINVTPNGPRAATEHNVEYDDTFVMDSL